METVDTDVLVVGAGAAGLLAAVAARGLGQRVIIVEASASVGGATACGDGHLWLPGNHLAAKLGATDSVEDGETYLDHILGAPTAASTAERRAAYIRTAGHLGRWLTSSKLPLAAVKGVPDHDPSAPGGKKQGRVLHSLPMDRRILGDWAARVRVCGPHTSASGAAGLLVAGRDAVGRLLRRGDHTSSGGAALVAELLRRATANGVEIWLESQVLDLLDDGAGPGAIVHKDGRDVTVTAQRGVILASGGFEANQELREEYLPLPTQTEWTTSGVGNRGDLLQLAVAHGAATAALDEAWWVPVITVDGRAHAIDHARAMPHGVIVDQAGDRFFNEASPSVIAGRQLYERSRGVRAVPSFLVIDNRHRQAHALGPWAAGSTPRKALDAGEIVRANTVTELAQLLGIDRAGLLGTVVRFNGFASKGRDLDFGRGESPWDKAMVEPGKRKNPSLGKVDKPPFWAVRVYPGDEGTKGGLLIDAESRVLRADGTPLPGLYACGGAAASIMKATSPAPGAALGAALIEAFRAVLAIVDQIDRIEVLPG